MLAFVAACGRQYRAELNCTLILDRLDANVGDVITLGKVVLLDKGEGVSLPSPTSQVKVKILEHTKGDKVVVFKKRRRKHYDKKTGFRASLTKVLVTEIQ